MKMRRGEYDELPWRPFHSANVKRAAFIEHGVDEDGDKIGALIVEFAAGHSYRYHGVRGRDWDYLLAAEEADKVSVGQTFHRTIRSTYAAERVSIAHDEEEDTADGDSAHADPAGR